MTRCSLIALGLALGGCTLVDQRTFNPHAQEKPVVVSPAAPAALPEAPELQEKALLRIPLPPPADAEAAIARAVAAARIRKPNVTFEVVGIAPESTAGQAAAAIAQNILAQHVPVGQVRIAVRPDPAVRPEVRVYVR